MDGQGRRFVNEASSYHHFVEGMVAARTVPAYLVCEAAFIRRYGLGAIAPQTANLKSWVARRYLTMAPTLAELARQLQMPAGALEAGSRATTKAPGRAWIRISAKALRCSIASTEIRTMGPIPAWPRSRTALSAPWPSGPGMRRSSAGLLTDAHGRVLDEAGERLAGLYACGNDAASVMQGHYRGLAPRWGPPWWKVTGSPGMCGASEAEA